MPIVNGDRYLQLVKCGDMFVTVAFRILHGLIMRYTNVTSMEHNAKVT